MTINTPINKLVSSSKEDKMKNILLYYRLNIFLDIYWYRTKSVDVGSMCSGLNMIYIKNNEDYNNSPIEFYCFLQDSPVWSAWLKILKIKLENIEGHKEWWNKQPKEFIKKSGSIEIDDSKQKEYVISFIKYNENEFSLKLEKLLSDFDNDPQTQREWEISWELLMKHWKNIN